MRTQMLDVGGAFHSPLMEPVAEAFAQTLADIPLSPPAVPVFSNRDGRVLPAEDGALRGCLIKHLVEPIDFVAQLRAMRAAGAEIFVEVGPGRGLTNLARRIFEDDAAATVLSTDGHQLAPLLRTVGELWRRGVDCRPVRLFDHRSVEELPIQRWTRTPYQPNKFAWRVSGTRAEPLDPSSRFAGASPVLLTAETAERERQGIREKDMADRERAAEMTQETKIRRTALNETLSAATQGDGDALLAAYREHQETMRHFLQAQERVLGMFLGTDPAEGAMPLATLGSSAVGSGVFPAPTLPFAPTLPSVVPQLADSAAASAKAVPSPSLDRAEITRILVDLVSDVTGYPPDMLDLKQDLEAELAVEFDQAPRGAGALPAAIAAGRRGGGAAGMDGDLADAHARTPGSRPSSAPWSRRSSRLSRRQPRRMPFCPEFPAAALPPADPPPGSPAPRQQPALRAHPVLNETPLADGEPGPGRLCPRYLMQARPAPAGGVPRDWLNGLHLIASGNDLLARFVAHAITQRGAEAVVIGNDELGDLDALSRHIAELRQQKGPVRGIVHMAGTRPWTPAATLDGWRADTARTAKSLFVMIQESLPDLLEPSGGKCGRIVAVSALGGLFARATARYAGSPVAGAAQGLLKSLALEHPELMTKCIDIDADMPTATTALQIVDDLCLWGGRVEIGLPRARRTVFDVVVAPLPKATAGNAQQPIDLPDDAVVLATGGAKGITAATLIRLARPGMRLILIGRSPLPGDESAALQACGDAGALRTQLLAEARSSNASVSPAEIEAQLNRILGEREVRANVARLTATGALVDYRALDIRDAAATAALVHDVRQRFGRIDAVLHGAGVIEDRLLADKAMASFDRVFDTKVDGLFNLVQALAPDELKLLAMFSSIAGRFGNRGQADYAAANEVLNRMVLRLAHDRPQTRMVAFNWGPWAGAGMASEAVNRQFRQRGIAPIPVEDGTRFVLDQLQAGDAVEVIAGHGDWQSGQVDEEAFFASQRLTAVAE